MSTVGPAPAGLFLVQPLVEKGEPPLIIVKHIVANEGEQLYGGLRDETGEGRAVDVGDGTRPGTQPASEVRGRYER